MRIDPPPHRDPKPPKLQMPANACDCHSHIFGPATQFPYADGRDYTPPDSTIDDYLALLKTLGIQRAVIVQPSVYGHDNACSENGIRALGANGRGVAVIDPGIPDSELERLHTAGFRGIRFNMHNTGGRMPLEALEHVAARVAELGWHVQFYMRGRELPDIRTRLKTLRAPVVIDHLGHMEAGQGLDQPGFQAMLQLLESGRCWVKLCPYRFDLDGPPYPNAKPFARALFAAAPERMVWGTDWPHPGVPGKIHGEPGPMPRDENILDALGYWFEDEKTVRMILADNPAVLYDFD